MTDQSPSWWPDDDKPDDEPRHACWEIFLPDGTQQKVASWPPLSRPEILAVYRCADAIPATS